MTTDLTTPSVTRGGRLTTGIAGLGAVAILGVFIAFSSTPDVTTPDAAARIDEWLAASGTASAALPALAIGVPSYVLFLIFFGGIRRVVETWSPAGIWASVTGLAAGLFLAGAVVSDALYWAVPLTRLTAPELSIPPGLVAVLDRGWLIALTEAQVALSVAIAAATVAGITARRASTRVPLLLIVLGIIAAAAVVPLILFPTVQIVFLASNQVRLLWIVAVSIWLLVPQRHPSGAPRRTGKLPGING